MLGVCKFLGLASYYRRYIQNVANITELLHSPEKEPRSNWTTACEEASYTLRIKLCQTACFSLSNDHHERCEPMFVVLTDASAVGIGAILEQDGHVVAYASRSLKSAKRNYSVIQ